MFKLTHILWLLFLITETYKVSLAYPQSSKKINPQSSEKINPRSSEKIIKIINVYDNEFYVVSDMDMKVDELHIVLSNRFPENCVKSPAAVRFPRILDQYNTKIDITINTTSSLSKTFDIFTPYGSLCSCFYAIQMLDGCIFQDLYDEQIRLSIENNFCEQDAIRQGSNQYMVRIPCHQTSMLRLQINHAAPQKKYNIIML
jgi:hypothetical protein